ncbi:MAG TPA: cysteine desulfurase family protein [Pseudogracilibacillus sp.]|nr:cysteine desulfurase family protein [Pseudogracilibacillus sp.]
MIYLDHAATAPVLEDVLEKMYQVEKEQFGNPSSIHGFGRQAKAYLNEARKFLAKSIQAKENELIFTSGGTEANNLAIIGAAIENEYMGNHIITSSQEHHAILHIMEYLQKRGFHVTYLPVNQDGQVNPEDVKRTLTDNTILVSVMYANNETGVMQPIEKIAEYVRDHQAHFHTDAVQAYSLENIDVNELGIDLLTTSGHKLNAPKGIGFLYASEAVTLQPITYGGSQEKKRRPGTENLIGAVGFHKAAEIAVRDRQENVEKYTAMKNLFLNVLEENEVDFAVNGELTLQLPTIVNISFPNTSVESLLTNLDLNGVAASGGSACTAGSLEPSHVLKAMFSFGSDRPTNSIRFSFGTFNTMENVEEAAEIVAKAVKQLAN